MCARGHAESYQLQAATLKQHLTVHFLIIQRPQEGSNFHLPTSPVRLRERWSDAQAPQSDEAWDDNDEVVSMEEDAAFRGDPQAQVCRAER